MKIYPLLILVLFSLLLSACIERNGGIGSVADDIAAIETQAGVVTEIDCPLKLPGEKEGETYYCGVFTVPLDYTQPEGKTLNLAFTLLRAENANPLPDPIVFLAGGPGQSGIVAAGSSLYGNLRKDRDLIFPAQRGTLFSHRLALDECVALLDKQMERSELNEFVESFSGLEKLDRSLPYDEYLAQYSQRTGAINARCHEAFSKVGLDPTQFTTANSTNDLVGMLEALGYDSFNLHGVSYGTRLALETLRRHPESGIRSVVLDSPVAPTVDRLVSLAGAVHGSILQLFADCAADTSCKTAYPNLLKRTNALVKQLSAQPITLDGNTIGADEFIAQLINLTNTRANYIPRMIAELEKGDATTYLALLNGEVGSASPEGSALSSGTDQFIKHIGEAAGKISGGNIMGGLQIMSDILKASQKDNPRKAMRAVAEEKLADSADLPKILKRIDDLTDDEIDELAGSLSSSEEKVDEVEIAKVTDAQAKNNALFMLSGIVCHEQLSFADINAALDNIQNLDIPALQGSEALLATEVGNCTNYPMGEPDPSSHEPVTSDVPILILQGEFDVRTPLQNGRTLSEQLKSSTLVIIPGAGHETWTGSGCVSRIGTSFFLDPQQIPDLTCLDTRRIRFSLPGEPLTGYSSQ